MKERTPFPMNVYFRDSSELEDFILALLPYEKLYEIGQRHGATSAKVRDIVLDVLSVLRKEYQ